MKKKLHLLFALLIAITLGGSLSAQEKTIQNTNAAYTPGSLGNKGSAISPFLGTPALISASKTTIIEAENYDIGGEGNAYHDADSTMNAYQYGLNWDFRLDEGVDVNRASQGGYSVGFTAGGEWLKYTVNIEATKSYIITARVASPPEYRGSNLVVSFSKNEDTTENLHSLTSNSWQDWIWSFPDTLELEAGEQVMTINILADAFDLDFIEIAPLDILPTAVTGVTLSATTLDLTAIDTVTLKAIVVPEDASRKQCTWKSSNTQVASVSLSGGVLITVGEGVDTITVTTDDGGYMAECVVTVSAIDVTGVTLSSPTLDLMGGDTVKLNATVAPEDASFKQVSWKTSNFRVATVNNGEIIGVGKGTATITATTKDGGFLAECIVTVTTIDVTGVTLSSPTLELNGGDTVTLIATVAPEDASFKQVSWKSSDVKVASVTNGYIIAVGKGTATITATTKDGGFLAECIITVTTIDVTGVSLSDDKLVMVVKDKDTLKVTITPDDAFIKTFRYKASNINIASVSNPTGIVTAIAVGVVNIIVTTTDGKFTDTCEVTVVPFPVGINSVSASRIVVYPNPSKDGLVSISIDKQTEDAVVNIYSLTGKSIYSEVLTKGETMRINRKIKPGFYLIKVSGKGLDEVRKLLVN